MKGILDKEEVFTVGKPVLLESNSPEEPFAVFFEDEGNTGYFYALNMELDQPIVDALHIYNVANVTDKEHSVQGSNCVVQRWTEIGTVDQRLRSRSVRL